MGDQEARQSRASRCAKVGRWALALLGWLAFVVSLVFRPRKSEVEIKPIDVKPVLPQDKSGTLDQNEIENLKRKIKNAN